FRIKGKSKASPTAPRAASAAATATPDRRSRERRATTLMGTPGPPKWVRFRPASSVVDLRQGRGLHGTLEKEQIGGGALRQLRARPARAGSLLRALQLRAHAHGHRRRDAGRRLLRTHRAGRRRHRAPDTRSRPRRPPAVVRTGRRVILRLLAWN